MLAMHTMTQEAAKGNGLWQLLEYLPLPENLRQARARDLGVDIPDYVAGYYPGRTLILDMDRSVHRDEGYSSWVQLPNGEIFVVDYINDDAPRAYIRSYRVQRQDIILFPEGDLPWMHPMVPGYLKHAEEMRKLQISINSDPQLWVN